MLSPARAQKQPCGKGFNAHFPNPSRQQHWSTGAKHGQGAQCWQEANPGIGQWEFALLLESQTWSCASESPGAAASLKPHLKLSILPAPLQLLLLP